MVVQVGKTFLTLSQTFFLRTARKFLEYNWKIVVWPLLMRSWDLVSCAWICQFLNLSYCFYVFFCVHLLLQKNPHCHCCHTSQNFWKSKPLKSNDSLSSAWDHPCWSVEFVLHSPPVHVWFDSRESHQQSLLVYSEMQWQLVSDFWLLINLFTPKCVAARWKQGVSCMNDMREVDVWKCNLPPEWQIALATTFISENKLKLYHFWEPECYFHLSCCWVLCFAITFWRHC